MLIGFDTNQNVTKFAERIVQKAGKEFACRYYRRDAKWASNLRREEVDAIFATGMAIVPVFQHKHNAIEEYTEKNATTDGKAAVARAKENKQPKSTAIYVAFDMDFTQTTIHYAMSYGQIFSKIVKDAGYGVGVYGDRQVLEALTSNYREEWGDVADHRWLTNARAWGTTSDWDIHQTSIPYTILPGLQVDDDVAKGYTEAGMWRAEA